ncbi:membrane anchored protein in chemotaxis locus [Shewanella gaetbuli]|uniref:Membrane anchored protein in chemotaxis locus n=1 Tax=Shewanella gaetbuli TaxID=220752 RepID=A0A9X1ZT52_9GAMM|nr:membrane anchored protein in chemotaxis locus [Shewanella gaetbuli]MCL1141666.1 membrane anchored protein in chemotaxis locus [Shewanella gaetbuli]
MANVNRSKHFVKPIQGNVLVSLLIFLLVTAVIALGSLYIETYKRNTLLKAEITRLEQSQVLLMVPDEQAADIANWLKRHPDQTQAILMQAGNEKQLTITDSNAPGLLEKEPKKVLIGPTDIEPSAAANTADINQNQTDVLMSEDEQGVKVIRLPHGGIRVTTRDLPQESQSN